MDIRWKAGWGQPPWCGVVIWKRFWILSCGKVVQKSLSGMSWKQLTIQVLLMVKWRQDKDVWCVLWGSFRLDSIVIITDFSPSIFLTTILYNALAYQTVSVAQGCELSLHHNKLLYILDSLTLDLKAVDCFFSARYLVFFIDSQKFDEFFSYWGYNRVHSYVVEDLYYILLQRSTFATFDEDWGSCWGLLWTTMSLALCNFWWLGDYEPDHGADEIPSTLFTSQLKTKYCNSQPSI